MWRVPSERIALNLDGPTVEVERLRSWMVEYECRDLVAAFNAASTRAAEHNVLAALIDRFMLEAQPSWDIVDHRGAVPANGRGMARLPLDVQLAIIVAWIETFVIAQEEPAPASAVDAVIAPGPANVELKRRLARARSRNQKAA